jgi:S-adenosylmethionine hydrolase
VRQPSHVLFFCMKKNPIIALLTDFGYVDGYVGSMKAVILKILPHANIIDISHQIPPQNIDAAAYVLWSSYKYFPKGTIFISVVDPGVGTERKILGLKTKNYFFLAPDNGLLKYILSSEQSSTVISVTNKKYFLPQLSSIFHGRDIFAPVAAHLAQGLPFSALGKKTIPATRAEDFVEVRKKGKYRGKVIHIDRFGNIITNFKQEVRHPAKLTLTIGNKVLKHWYSTYHEAKSNIPFVIKGSSGLLEISIKNGNASSLLMPTQSQSMRLDLE